MEGGLYGRQLGGNKGVGNEDKHHGIAPEEVQPKTLSKMSYLKLGRVGKGREL